MELIIVASCVALAVGFMAYNAGCMVGCLKERKKWLKKTGKLDCHDVEEFYPEEI